MLLFSYRMISFFFLWCCLLLGKGGACDVIIIIIIIIIIGYDHMFFWVIDGFRYEKDI